MDNLLKELTDLLLSDGEFASDGSILKNKLIEAVFASEVSILKILLNSETLKSHFFVEVEGTLIFDKIKFQEFVTNKEFLPDSFTAFENRIGLTAGDSYLSQANEVVLSWPYKDCILEGGMLKTEQKREEIFWNTNLSPENITRLFEPKALIGWEYWDKDAISKGKAMPVERLCLNDNLLIKGNNLLALYSLKTRYAGRIKLIYIDPPYNTGSDTFKYNDRVNHSAWLTFMRNRLEIAKELLSPTGTIFVNLDDNEAHYCKVLMDEIFGRQNFIANIIWQKR